MKPIWILTCLTLLSTCANSATVAVFDTVAPVPVTDFTGHLNAVPNVPSGTGFSNQSTTFLNVADTSGNLLPGVALSFSGWYLVGDQYATNPGVWNDPDSTDSFTSGLASDYIWHERSDSPGIIRFSGLNPGLTYDMRIMSVRSVPGTFYNHRRATFTANGRLPDGWTSTTTHEAYLDGWLAGKTIDWSSLVPNSDGTITIDARSANLVGSYAYVSAIELVVIPEPSCLLLTCTGATLFCVSRRRSRFQATC